uniref:Ubiquitin-like domain-containing protein n=2 Tax=Aegilops tauschii TaxID=37682 RepID=A0A453CXV0_AEGTS
VPLLITLKVVGQKRALRHTMRMDDKLQVLQDVWYHKVDVTHGTGVFMIDGSKFSAKSTPDDLELEDGDLVDFFEHMDGGALVALH